MKTPRFWRNINPQSLLLWPLSFLYGLAAEASRTHYKPKQAAIPVISIGNVTAGGAGKTPTAMALLPLLTALGAKVHFITRGYQSDTPLRAHQVTDADTWQSVGDEALLLARLAPTWVGSDRLASAKAVAEAGASLGLCDDALQHHRLQKNISLLVIDGPYGIGNGFLLPAGPLREPLKKAVARCHAVILIGEDKQKLAEKLPLPIFRAQLVPTLDKQVLAGQSWFAFAGIGRPEKFFATLQSLDAALAGTRAFPDHHAYTVEDFTELTTEAARLNARLITTEKDAVKLSPEQRAQVTVLPVTLQFEEPEKLQAFLRELLTPATEA